MANARALSALSFAQTLATTPGLKIENGDSGGRGDKIGAGSMW